VEALVQAIQQDTTVAMSNGFYKDKLRAAAWTIKGNMVEHWLFGVGQTPGVPDNQSAYCSELWCILASLKYLSDDHKILSGSKVEVACDGLSALKKVSNSYPTNPRELTTMIILVLFKSFKGSYH